MEGKLLVEAVRDGKIKILENLLKESPTVADIRLISLEESLLHVATKSGQISFVHELLKIDPHGAEELDKVGFRPLDIAVILGNLEIVKELLGCNKGLVRLKGKEQRTALHYAAMKGRVDVLNEFLSISPTSVEDITVYEENTLHLAVKSCQVDVFANLVMCILKLNKEWLINMGDGDGNTVVHLAVSTKQLMQEVNMEAEFVACVSAVHETVWLRRFLQHLGIVNTSVGAVTLHYDNQATIAYTKDPKYHGKTKHIDTKYNFVRDIIGKKRVILKYISTRLMVADPMTKPIARDVFMGHVKSLGLRRI